MLPSLSQRYIYDKTLKKMIWSFFSEVWDNFFPSYNVDKSFKKFLDPDSEADDYQNLISSSLYTDTSLVKLSWNSDQRFVCEVANGQKNRQTDNFQVKHKLLGAGAGKSP